MIVTGLYLRDLEAFAGIVDIIECSLAGSRQSYPHTNKIGVRNALRVKQGKSFSRYRSFDGSPYLRNRQLVLSREIEKGASHS